MPPGSAMRRLANALAQSSTSRTARATAGSLCGKARRRRQSLVWIAAQACHRREDQFRIIERHLDIAGIALPWAADQLARTDEPLVGVGGRQHEGFDAVRHRAAPADACRYIDPFNPVQRLLHDQFAAVGSAAAPPCKGIVTFDCGRPLPA
jgi:hypothetical protein